MDALEVYTRCFETLQSGGSKASVEKTPSPLEPSKIKGSSPAARCWHELSILRGTIQERFVATTNARVVSRMRFKSNQTNHRSLPAMKTKLMLAAVLASAALAQATPAISTPQTKGPVLNRSAQRSSAGTVGQKASSGPFLNHPDTASGPK